jgi:FkbM family methyltransferase
MHASSIAGEAIRAGLRRTARAALTRVPVRGMHRFSRDVGPRLAPAHGTDRIRIGGVDFPIDHTNDTHRYIYYGAYEQETVRHMRDALRPGDVAIDGGANIGYITAEMAASVGPTGHVYAFEPSRACHALLARLAAQAGNIEIVAGAVSSRTGAGAFFDTERVFTSGYGVLGDISKPPDAIPYDVPTWALDDFCAERGVARLRYLKLDVEGSELAALRGAERLLHTGSIDFVHVELSFGESDVGRTSDAAIAALLVSAGYRPHRALRRGALAPIREASYRQAGTRDIVWARGQG